jgi:hypothetical protein
MSHPREAVVRYPFEIAKKIDRYLKKTRKRLGMVNTV